MSNHILDTKLQGTLMALSLEIKKPYYFQETALFWSLNRLFGFYYRIVSVYSPISAYHGNKDFLDSDLESYIIRHRIILNDIAYILWQLLKLFNLDFKVKFNKGAHPGNNELSFFEFARKLKKDTNPLLDNLRNCIDIGMTEFSFMENQRNNIAHYKSMIMIFGDGPDFEFAIMNPMGTMPTISENGQTKLVVKNVFKFTNNQHLFLWNWMNNELVDAINHICITQGINFDSSKFSLQMHGGSAIGLFKEINKI